MQALLNEKDVARMLSVSVATVRRWRLLGAGPNCVKVGGSLVRYKLSDIDAFLSQCPTKGGR
jgi:predicted DNA-binding transcriptional regulator AlpA